MQGNLGQAVVKISAVAEQYRSLTAPCRIFDCQNELHKAFTDGTLNEDRVIVVRCQGPRANGMPELHKLVPPLAVVQERGYRVALLTDGRMSGASGKVLAAIHTSPETICGGVIGKLRDGDIVTIDATQNILHVELSEEQIAARPSLHSDTEGLTLGRKIFSSLRKNLSSSETGGSLFCFDK